MPLTAKLSREFYDRLGERMAKELVDWFNAVDTMYRTDLREINELNIARVDAKLAALEARIDYKLAAIENERRLVTQRCWLVATWLTVLAAVIGLYFRG